MDEDATEPQSPRHRTGRRLLRGRSKTVEAAPAPRHAAGVVRTSGSEAPAEAATWTPDGAAAPPVPRAAPPVPRPASDRPRPTPRPTHRPAASAPAREATGPTAPPADRPRPRPRPGAAAAPAASTPAPPPTAPPPTAPPPTAAPPPTTALSVEDDDDIAKEGPPRPPLRERLRSSKAAALVVLLRGGKGGARLVRLVILVVVVVAVALTLRTYVVAPYYIPSQSMEPTLHGCPGCNNDHVLVDKLSYRFHQPHAGDIVVFDKPPSLNLPDPVLIKRVVGVGGELLVLKHGDVYVNGQRVSEPYINKACPKNPSTPETGRHRWQIPLDDVFVMGDNRCNSTDSRTFGPIPDSSIVGRAFVIVWPFKHFTFL